MTASMPPGGCADRYDREALIGGMRFAGYRGRFSGRTGFLFWHFPFRSLGGSEYSNPSQKAQLARRRPRPNQEPQVRNNFVFWRVNPSGL